MVIEVCNTFSSHCTCQELGVTYPAREKTGEEILFFELLSRFSDVLAEERL